MKFYFAKNLFSVCRVILYARMWIEMFTICIVSCSVLVILYARMWIEINCCTDLPNPNACHPLCEDVD